ncbi:MAG: hypothetical protein IKY95_00635 [Bacteroidales bacterium]|nr:hypothetical protein [Bacteroidales bacterium]
MKRNRFILIACLFTAMLAGCSVNEEGIFGSFPYLEIDQTSINLPKTGSVDYITYKSNRSLITKVESQFGNWLQASAQDGQIALTFQENGLESERTATVTITTPNSLITKSITVTQDASGELTFNGDLKLRNKEEIRQNSYTIINGELVIANVGSLGTRSVSSSVSVECGERTYTGVAATDVDDEDMLYLADTIHFVQDQKLSVINAELTEFPIEFIRNVNINQLYLPYNEIQELPDNKTLKGLSLYRLSLEGNNIKDISNLENCNTITYLNLAGNDIHDLSPLLEMNSLGKVVLTGLPLTKPQLDVFKEKFSNEVEAENITDSEAPVPVISNIVVEELDENTVKLTAKVERNRSNLTKYGFYIGTSRNINEMSFHEGDLSSDGTITYVHSVSTLVGKVYHARATATNGSGEGYSNASSYGTRISDTDIKLMYESDFENFYYDCYSHIYGSLYVGYMTVYDKDGIHFKNDTEEFYFSRMSDYSSMEFTNLSKLSGLVYVSEGIYIGNTDITNIDHITHVEGMHTLYLKGNKIKQIPELECAGTLKSLDVSRNALTSFSFLEKLPELETLYLGDNDSPSKETNDIGILTGLEKYTNIKHLELSGLPLHQFQVDDLKKLMPETEIVFKSGGRNPHLPTVSAGSFEKGNEKVTLKGSVTNKGKSDIIEHGFYVGKDKENLEKVKVGDEISVNKTFSLEMNIYDEDVYYFYPYAVNDLGETRTAPTEFSLAYEDLCTFGTANSYIVPKEGKYRFNATVKGYSSEQIHPTSVSVLWETLHTYAPFETGAIIKSIKLVGGEVEFETTGQEGNALIAVKDDSGTILWSWHIWATDEPSVQTWTNEFGTYYMMDRNLGATRSSGGGSNRWREATGTLYQLGRKDPFIYESSFDLFSYVPSIEETVKQPTAFSKNGDYWSTDSIENLWSPDTKTKWDPCPPGYMVASYYAYSYLANNGWEWDYGRSFVYDSFTGGSSEAWFPATPYIDCGGGNCWWDGCGQIRTTGASNSYGPNKELFYYDGNGGWFNSYSAGDGFPVRCMRMNEKISVQTMAPVSGETSISANGVLILNMDVTVEEKGFVWGTSDYDPTLSYYDGVIKASDTSKGKFSCVITGLEPNSTYYIRAYAKADGETAYGETIKVNTSSPGSGEGFTGDDFEW